MVATRRVVTDLSREVGSTHYTHWKPLICMVTPHTTIYHRMPNQLGDTDIGWNGPMPNEFVQGSFLRMYCTVLDYCMQNENRDKDGRQGYLTCFSKSL
jgi:hypothetical protein